MARLRSLGCLILFLSLPSTARAAAGSDNTDASPHAGNLGSAVNQAPRIPAAWRVDFFPPHALWGLPIASQHEPRIGGKMSTLGGRSADTAIGGVFPIAHLVPTARAGDGVELDLAVGVFTRFDRRYSLAVADYLVRIPVTWTHGRTWLQVAFAHRSSHLGDDALKASGAVTTTRARDELELSGGLDISPRLRALARAAVIVNSKGMPPGRGRAGLGLEWRPTSDGPFAAIDVDERSWHNWVAGVTVRSGWQWRRASGRTLRLALEGYNGRSPFGQALEDKEEWLAATFDLDW